MKKIALLLVMILALAYSASATPSALTNVTVTLQDNNGQVWSNASWQAIFVASFNNPGIPNNNGNAITPNQSGTANGSGTFTVTLDDNNVVAPAGSKWKFIICPNATVAGCSTIITTVTGVSQNLSATINPQLDLPTVSVAPSLSRAYADTNANGGFGGMYFNTIDNTLKLCESFYCLGTGWVTVSVSPINPVFSGTVSANCFKAIFDASNDALICPQGGTGHINLTLPAVSGTFALLDSPVFTGDPTAPTPVLGDNDNSVATTAFVKGQNYVTATTAPVRSVFTRAGDVVAAPGDYNVGQITGAAPLASPTFTGDPQAPTPAPGDNDTSIATTAFVQDAVNTVATTGKVVSLTTNTGTAIGASATTWITKSTTMPSSGCPCRVLISYSAMYTSGGSGAADFWVEDGLGHTFATAQVLTNTAGSDAAGASASSISPVTYANNATVTFVGRGFTSSGGGITVASASVGGSTQASWLSIVVISSN